jgi:predicted phage tail protein
MTTLIGAKGKKPPTQRAPVESPNTLRSVSKGRILDLIGHGPIVGLADGMKSVFLDDTALQNADGTFNFEGVTVTTREGYPDQEHIPGFRAVENPHDVSTEVKFGVPVIRAVTNNDADAVVVNIQVASLGRQDQTTGDSLAHTVSVSIEIRLNGGAFNTALTDTISGKTTSAYQRSYRVELPTVAGRFGLVAKALMKLPPLPKAPRTGRQ